MNVSYRRGALAVEGLALDGTPYDVGNTLLNSQFDGRGGISRYAVINKFEAFGFLHLLFSLDGRALDGSERKSVTAAGRKLTAKIYAEGAEIETRQFLSDKDNAVFYRIEVFARKDLDFKAVINFGVNYNSYLTELFLSRFKLSSLPKIALGALKKHVKSTDFCIKNDILSDFYIDFASDNKLTALERNFFFVNQFKTEVKMRENERRVVNLVVSAGTRKDFSDASAEELLKVIAEKERNADAYTEELNGFYDKNVEKMRGDNEKITIEDASDITGATDKTRNTTNCADDENGELKRALYVSCVNCAVSNYKEKGDFKALLAGVVYQFPARTYFRDGYWTSLPLIAVRPGIVRGQILTLARGIGKKGECPSAVKSSFKNYWGNHCDSPSFFVMLIRDYIAHTGDFSILREKIRGRTLPVIAEAAVERLRGESDETGLIVKKGRFNRRDWCDNVFREGYVTYDEALYARALYCLSEIFSAFADRRIGGVGLSENAQNEGGILANPRGGIACGISEKRSALTFREKADFYRRIYEKVVKSINDILWDEERGRFVNYKNGGFTEDNLSADTVTVALFRLASEERIRRMLENMEAVLESKNNKRQVFGDFGVLSVFPFYKDVDAVVQKSSLPYYYHNGGEWPYLSAAYAYAKLMYGMDYEYPLTRWFSYNTEKGNLTPVEFFSPAHKDGSLMQGWSAMSALVFNHADGGFFDKKIARDEEKGK